MTISLSATEIRGPLFWSRRSQLIILFNLILFSVIIYNTFLTIDKLVVNFVDPKYGKRDTV